MGRDKRMSAAQGGRGVIVETDVCLDVLEECEALHDARKLPWEGGCLTPAERRANSTGGGIIDDNVDLAENIAEILQIDGHETDVAASAEEALPKDLSAVPDVVVTDYRLPGANEAAFVRQFRQLRMGVYAVVISAYTDEQTIDEARKAGATFLAKPVDFKVLRQLIREATA
jgi:CheY-like chemotaxis protein